MSMNRESTKNYLPQDRKHAVKFGGAVTFVRPRLSLKAPWPFNAMTSLEDLGCQQKSESSMRLHWPWRFLILTNVVDLFLKHKLAEPTPAECSFTNRDGVLVFSINIRSKMSAQKGNMRLDGSNKTLVSVQVRHKWQMADTHVYSTSPPDNSSSSSLTQFSNAAVLISRRPPLVSSVADCNVLQLLNACS